MTKRYHDQSFLIFGDTHLVNGWGKSTGDDRSQVKSIDSKGDVLADFSYFCSSVVRVCLIRVPTQSKHNGCTRVLIADGVTPIPLFK